MTPQTQTYVKNVKVFCFYKTTIFIKVIQDLNIDHSVKGNKILHERLPGGTSNTTTVLYHRDPVIANQVGSKGEIKSMQKHTNAMGGKIDRSITKDLKSAGSLRNDQ